MEGMEIEKIESIEVLDSRGMPTLRTRVTLRCGASGVASVPSGASTGKYEAYELRDKKNERYFGKGVLLAIENVKNKITPALLGVPATDGQRCDSIMITLDGTHNKSNLGANAILSVSIALHKAAAQALGVSFYKYLGGFAANRMPIPMMNIINGGMHACNDLDIQEFMILPTGAASFSEGVRICAEIYQTLKRRLIARKMSACVGDEGGFSPSFGSNEAAIEAILEAVNEAGYRSGDEVRLGLDIASGGWYQNGEYVMEKSKKRSTREELLAYYRELCEKYPIFSIEDGFAEDDDEGWKKLTKELGGDHSLVGDDLFVTNTERLKEGIRKGIANTVLIKPNQIGTVSETAECIQLAKRNGYKVILSHRSGDTADTSIADMAVAFGVDLFKSGAPCRGERTEKYNRLLAIENEMFCPTYGEDFV